jgi:hypothetical protein
LDRKVIKVSKDLQDPQDLVATKDPKEIHLKVPKVLRETHPKVVKEMLDLLQRESRVPKV